MKFLSKLKLYFYLVFTKRKSGIITFQISIEDQKKLILGEKIDFSIYFSGVDQRVIDIFTRQLYKENGELLLYT